MNKLSLILTTIVALATTLACTAPLVPRPTPEPTATVVPSPVPTETPHPTYTRYPTYTPIPTATLAPMPTLSSTEEQLEERDCARFIENSFPQSEDSTATLLLLGFVHTKSPEYLDPQYVDVLIASGIISYEHLPEDTWAVSNLYYYCYGILEENVTQDLTDHCDAVLGEFTREYIWFNLSYNLGSPANDDDLDKAVEYYKLSTSYYRCMGIRKIAY